MHLNDPSQNNIDWKFGSNGWGAYVKTKNGKGTNYFDNDGILNATSKYRWEYLQEGRNIEGRGVMPFGLMMQTGENSTLESPHNKQHGFLHTVTEISHWVTTISHVGEKLRPLSEGIEKVAKASPYLSIPLTFIDKYNKFANGEDPSLNDVVTGGLAVFELFAIVAGTVNPVGLAIIGGVMIANSFLDY